MSGKISRHSLRIKCVSCKTFLPLALFGNNKTDLRMLSRSKQAVCSSCQTVCRDCGKPILLGPRGGNASNRVPRGPRMTTKTRQQFIVKNNTKSDLWAADLGDASSSSSSGSQQRGVVCENCAERSMLANTNVYYRFPMLKYKACPFPVEKFRKLIVDETRRGK